MMRVYALALCAVLLSVALPAYALTSLEKDSKCIGGTLVDTYYDVQDGGGLTPYTNAGVIGYGDCQMIGKPGQCCALSVRTNGGGFGGPLIPYTWFSYEFFEGAQVQGGFPPYQTGPLANQPGNTSNDRVGEQGTYYAGIVGGVTPQEVTAVLVANPPSIRKGGESVLSWSSTGAVSCTGNFPTGGATSGTLLVSPTETKVYTITCTNQTGSTCLADGEEVPAGNLCSEDKTISPPITNTTWDACCSGTARVVCPAPNEPAEAFCTSRNGSGGTTSQGQSVNSATASATVTVENGGLQVSCYGHPPRAHIGQDVLWTSSVSGPVGTYTYAWSGSDGLSGVTKDVRMQYLVPGVKRAQLTVTYSPFTDSDAACVYVPKGEPYFTKVCSGGSNSTNIQQPQCDSIPTFPSGGPGDVGKICKQSAECDPSPIDPEGATPSTYYGMVQNYVCGDVPVEPPVESRPRPTTGGTGGVRPSFYQTFVQIVFGDWWTSNEQLVTPNYIETVKMIEGTVKGDSAQTVTVQCDNRVTVTDSDEPQCSDGIDNDEDGDIDARDRGCSGGPDDGYDPRDDSEGGTGENTTAQCSDGIDNNGDGNIDWPDDPGCSSADDNLELTEPAEVTFKVDPPLIKKNQACTLTLSARNVSTCTLSGPGITRSFSATAGLLSLREVLTPTLSQTSTYTLSCSGIDGKKVSKSVDCKIAPTFEEI